MPFDPTSPDYRRIEKAIRYIDEHQREQPDLKEVAAEVGLSEFHFQRLFSRWAGVSPKRFLQFLTAEGVAQALRNSATALEAALGAGLSSTSRLHDLTISVEAATPGQIRSGGAGMEIRMGVDESPFGPCLIATTSRGICEMAFVEVGALSALRERIHARWPAADFVDDDAHAGDMVRRIFEPIQGDAPLPLLLRGTNFQIRVWKALLEVPAGTLTTYGELARKLDMPTGSRAVGAAVGANRIAYLIPCHRVILSTGAFGQFRWGTLRKRAIIGWEAARLPSLATA